MGLAILVASQATAPAADEYARERERLIREIADDARATAYSTGLESFDERVMTAMQNVPRHEFVPERQKPYAYANRPLPIGHGQTISQPYIVALMTALARPAPTDRVLEVGTGSGYQAAVLAELVARVHSMEIIEPLQAEGAERLSRLGYANVETRLGDGYHGWPEAAPFDAIIVTAAASHIPLPLIEQIRLGGIMVIPVGGRFQVQQLTVVEKELDGTVRTRQLLPVRFVPLTGDH